VIDSYMTGFTDARDAGPRILTHLYLLLGCAGPCWAWLATSGSKLIAKRLLSNQEATGALVAAPLAGVAVLGAGDAAAAVVGIIATSQGWAHTWAGAFVRVNERPTAAARPVAWPGARKTIKGRQPLSWPCWLVWRRST